MVVLKDGKWSALSSGPTSNFPRTVYSEQKVSWFEVSEFHTRFTNHESGGQPSDMWPETVWNKECVV